MKFEIRPKFLALATGLLSLSVASSQTTQQADQVSIKIDFVAWGDAISGLSVTTGGKGTSVTALPFRYSEPVAYNGPSLLEIYQNGSAAPAPEVSDAPDAAVPIVPATKPDEGDGRKLSPLIEKLRKDKPNLASIAQLPANSRRVTILLGPGPSGTFQSYVIDDDPSHLPVGRMRIHNLSPFTVAVRCNKSKAVELRTRQTTLVPPQESFVVYELAYQDHNEWKVQENNLVRVGDKEQVQFVILKSSNSYFTSSDGSQAGFLQTVVLRRNPTQSPAAAAPR